MYVQQFYTKCLSEAAYYIESDGEAAIIDPLRDIEEYLQLAKSRNASIRYVFETHFHADFVSGHLDLARVTGAPIVFGPGATTGYKVYHAKDGEVFKLGACSMEVLHTPGHTMESVCYLLRNENGAPHALFTGDTLFVGDVGRPDLSSGGMSSEELAGILYHSLQDKILPLPDEVLVYPAHGPGSSCGKSLGPETWSTLGDQKKMNYALKAATKESFVEQVTSGLQEAPAYFAINAQINQKGYTPLNDLKQQGLKPLPLEAFKEAAQTGAILLDTRSAATFTGGFIPGSIFIGLEGRFAEWAGALLPFNQPILLITDPGSEEASLVRLSRVGFEKIIGYLDGGFETWMAAGETVDMIIDVEADELIMDIPHDPRLVIVDVRKEGEFAEGHLKDAVNLPLSDLRDVAEIAHFNDTQNLYIHCAGGYRSVIAASLFKKHGFHNLRNVLGGWSSISKIKNVSILKETAALN